MVVISINDGSVRLSRDPFVPGEPEMKLSK